MGALVCGIGFGTFTAVGAYLFGAPLWAALVIWLAVSPLALFAAAYMVFLRVEGRLDRATLRGLVPHSAP